MKKLILAFFYIQLIVNTVSFAQVTLISSKLPIIIINTPNSAAIPNEPKVMADMEIIYNGAGKINSISDLTREYKGKIGIELRGSSSQDLSPKKPYGIETRNIDGSNLNISLLGMPKENDWVLLAPYSDKSLIRDVLIHRVASEMMPYTSRSRICEVVVNGQYQGVYVLMEKIKRDRNRVNINELLTRHNAGDSLTGGYILKIDKTTGSQAQGGFNTQVFNSTGKRTFYQYDEPEANVITASQKVYIQTLLNNFETTFTTSQWKDPEQGFRKYADENSMIDFMILQEVANNVDGYRLSTYLYKDLDSKNKKIRFGPLWDFNLGFGNANYCSGGTTDVMAYDFASRCPTDGFSLPFYWPMLLQDSAYDIHLYRRWTALRRGVLNEQNLHLIIDSLVNHMGEAVMRNFQKWPVLGTYIWPNLYVGGTYPNEIKYLKDWISARLKYLDVVFLQLTLPKYYPERFFPPIVYPNPALANQPITFKYYVHDYDRIRLEIYDFTGRYLQTVNDKDHFNGVNSIEHKSINLPAGIYSYKLFLNTSTNAMKIGKIIVR